jgi:hypothetical protein
VLCGATLDGPTDRRLAPGVPDTIAALRWHRELEISDATAALVCSMSAATIDRPPGRGPLEAQGH